MTQDNTITESEALEGLSNIFTDDHFDAENSVSQHRVRSYITQSASKISDLTRERDEARAERIGETARLLDTKKSEEALLKSCTAFRDENTRLNDLVAKQEEFSQSASKEILRLQSLLDEACVALEYAVGLLPGLAGAEMQPDNAVYTIRAAKCEIIKARTALSKIRGLGSSPDLRSTPEVSSEKKHIIKRRWNDKTRTYDRVATQPSSDTAQGGE